MFIILKNSFRNEDWGRNKTQRQWVWLLSFPFIHTFILQMFIESLSSSELGAGATGLPGHSLISALAT